MKRCMVDLETLGTVPGCTILSIGAVMFDEESKELGNSFYVTINRESCKKNGLVENEDTLKWWNQQIPESRGLLDETSLGGQDLYDAIRMFEAWLSESQYHDWIYRDNMTTDKSKIMDELEVWGNGSDFDNAILAYAYKAIGEKPCWKFYNNRCYRTLKNLYPQIPLLQRVGVHHNALDDARTQAIHAMQILRRHSTRKEPTFMEGLSIVWRSIKNEFKWLP